MHGLGQTRLHPCWKVLGLSKVDIKSTRDIPGHLSSHKAPHTTAAVSLCHSYLRSLSTVNGLLENDGGKSDDGFSGTLL